MMEARAGVRARAGARASRTALRIYCKSSLEYWGILVAATRVLAMRGFVSEGLVGWSDNFSEVERSQGERQKKRRKDAYGGDTRGLGLRLS